MFLLYIGMLMVSVIYGTRRTNKVLGQVDYPCAKCGKPGHHTIVRSQKKMTLYFIPLIPLGTAFISRCNLCGYQEQVTKEKAQEWFPSR